jgi:hypothetical protein
MIKAKAIELLRTFSGQEMKEFGLFICSPYFNRERVLIEFYEIVKKYHPSFESKVLTKERIFKKLYPDKKYNDGMMRNILSKTLSLGEKFITIKNLESKPFSFRIALLEELSQRKSEKLFLKWEKEILDLVDNEIIKNEAHFYRKSRMAETHLQFRINQKSQFSGTGAGELKIIQSNLIVQFLISVFKNVIYLMNERKQMYLPDYDSDLMSMLEKYILKHSDELKSIVYLWYYYNSFKLASTLEERYFYELREIFLKNYQAFTNDDKRNIYTILTNFCYMKINKGDKKFSGEHLSLIKESVERKQYRTSAKYMSHIFYMNAVIVALAEGDTRWVKNFIDSYKNDLDDTNRENTYSFVKALFHYHAKDYDTALKKAAEIRTNDLSYKHQLKSFYLKIFFDMNEPEQFYSQVDNYRHFISAEKNTPGVMRAAISNYILFVKRLFDIKLSDKESDYELSKLKKDVNKCADLINKEWILERVNTAQKRG